MKIVVLDESKKMRQKITETLEEKGHTVITCLASGAFMDAIESSTPGKVLMNVDSWKHGKAMYTYFKIQKRLEDIPIVFYNVPDKFTSITDRNPHKDDKIYSRQTAIEDILNEF